MKQTLFYHFHWVTGDRKWQHIYPKTKTSTSINSEFTMQHKIKTIKRFKIFFLIHVPLTEFVVKITLKNELIFYKNFVNYTYTQIFLSIFLQMNTKIYHMFAFYTLAASLRKFSKSINNAQIKKYYWLI